MKRKTISFSVAAGICLLAQADYGGWSERIEGVTRYDHYGLMVNGAGDAHGDVDGDGAGDLLILAGGVADEDARIDVWSPARQTIVYSIMPSDVGSYPFSPKGRIRYANFLGDLDGDYRAEIAVSTTDYDVHGTGVRAVHLFSGRDKYRLRLHTGDVVDGYFGCSVVGMKDINRDGVRDYAISSPDSLDARSNGYGSVMVYSGNSGDVLDASFATAPAQGYGWSLASVERNNGDPDSPNLLIGCPLSNGNRGLVEAWVMKEWRDGRTVLRWRQCGTRVGERFGYAIATVSPRGRCVVGSPTFDGPAGADSGRATVLSDDGSAVMTFEGELPLWKFGRSLAGLDFNGDQGTFDEVAVGAQSSGTIANGGLYVFNTGRQAPVLFRKRGESPDMFGLHVCSPGSGYLSDADDVAVSAWRQDGAAGPQAGAVFVYPGR